MPGVEQPAGLILRVSQQIHEPLQQYRLAAPMAARTRSTPPLVRASSMMPYREAFITAVGAPP